MVLQCAPPCYSVFWYLIFITMPPTPDYKKGICEELEEQFPQEFSPTLTLSEGLVRLEDIVDEVFPSVCCKAVSRLFTSPRYLTSPQLPIYKLFQTGLYFCIVKSRGLKVSEIQRIFILPNFFLPVPSEMSWDTFHHPQLVFPSNSSACSKWIT